MTLNGLGTVNCIFHVSTLFVTCDLYCREEGRHAGPGGDIEQIVVGAMEKRPDLSIRTTSVLAGRVLHSALELFAIRRCGKVSKNES